MKLLRRKTKVMGIFYRIINWIRSFCSDNIDIVDTVHTTYLYSNSRVTGIKNMIKK